MILYINSCPREESRTDRLAHALLDKLGAYTEIKLYEESLQPLNSERLNYRTELIEKGDYADPIFDSAKQFAAADIIVMAAPYWDASFPAELKIYIENIYVTGIVSKYADNGMPVGLCRASKLYYVTTAGGPYDQRFSYDYIAEMAIKCMGIKETALIKAEMLDIVGNNPDRIVDEAINHICL